jgi:hypothetical protein
MSDPELMGVLRIDQRERIIIVVKLDYLDPVLRTIAKSSILVLRCGCTSELLKSESESESESELVPYRNDK